jgi:hypothetical protein
VDNGAGPREAEARGDRRHVHRRRRIGGTGIGARSGAGSGSILAGTNSGDLRGGQPLRRLG